MGITLTRGRPFAIAMLCAGLAACGGGGGSSDTAATSPTGVSTQTGGPSPATAEIPNSKPTIGGSPPQAVLADSTYSFQPTASDSDGDVLSFRIQNAPAWAKFDLATGKLEGKPGPGEIGTYSSIVISVTDGAADASLNAFSITVESVGNSSLELSWQAPTENEDGSPLTDLAGYKLYWGTTPGDYTNSVTIDNPGVLTYVLDNLVPNTYYFVATAFNTGGAESSPSPMASATL